ncbi:MAG: ABC transporter permease [Geodermatophilaceae bacterium]|nr:ABC transporter permease [Geodermatophilaceae bacterium]
MSTTTSPASDTSTATGRPARAPARNRTALLAAAVGIPLLAAILLSAFAWPAANIAPRDLPIGVVGPPPAVAAVRAQLAEQEGAFAVTSYADVPAAEQAIAERDIYGAIALSPDGPVLLSSTAASPVVATLLADVARGIGAAQGVSPEVRDVVAADPDDPRGSGLAVTVLPMVILGGALGTITALLTRDRLRRLGVLAAGAVTAGLSGVLLIQGGLAIIGGDWWLNTGVLALTVAAIGATVAGLGCLLGPPGIALGALTMVLLGNPLSGSTSAPELLPQPWGAVGQGMPPGAGATLLRGTAFFDGAGASRALWTLCIWLVFGLVLVVLAPARSGRGPDAAVPG